MRRNRPMKRVKACRKEGDAYIRRGTSHLAWPSQLSNSDLPRLWPRLINGKLSFDDLKTILRR